MAEAETILGIDLGTTNSLVAVADAKGVRVLKDSDSPLIPSVIAFDEEGKIQAVGHRAKTLKSISPERVIYSVKRLMGKGKADLQKLSFDLPFDLSPSSEEIVRIRVAKKAYTPIELSAAILSRCKSVAENALGRSVRKAVITVPAYFNDAERSATALAGKLAGLEVVRILNEPTAAALAFGIGQKKDESELVAVYDFGGGTFDISILKVKSGIFEVVSTAGDTQLGGDDLDHSIYKLLLTKMSRAPQTEEEKILLLSQLESLKRKLSDVSEVETRLYWGNAIQWEGKITRAEIEQAMTPIVERTLDCCRRALEAAQIQPRQIAHIVLVGGSSRLPLVRKRVEEFFGKTPNTSVNPEEVVALGAAIQGSILAGEKKDALLLDVVPLSLGLETMGGVVTKLIPRNSTIPTSASEHFTTYADNQTAVDLHILQGERELVRDNRSLGRFKLRIPPAPAGIPKIEVLFMMDANGILRVKAVDLKTKQEATLEVKPSFGLSESEVEQMLQSAWDNASRDFKERQLIESVNHAKSLIQATEKSLTNPLLEKTFIEEQRKKLSPTIAALKKDLEFGNASVIDLRTKELDHLSQDLANALITASLKSNFEQPSIESRGHRV